MAKRLRLFDPQAPGITDSKLAQKFIRSLMMNQGKLSTARRILGKTFELIEKCIPAHPLDVLASAVEQVQPAVEVRAKRAGTATYYVPMLVGPARQQTLAIRWIIQASLGKSGKPMHVRLAETIVAAHRGAWKSD